MWMKCEMHKPKPKHALHLFGLALMLWYLLPLVSASDAQTTVAVALVVMRIRDTSLPEKEGRLTQSLLYEIVIEIEFDVVVMDVVKVTLSLSLSLHDSPAAAFVVSVKWPQTIIFDWNKEKLKIDLLNLPCACSNLYLRCCCFLCIRHYVRIKLELFVTKIKEFDLRPNHTDLFNVMIMTSLKQFCRNTQYEMSATVNIMLGFGDRYRWPCLLFTVAIDHFYLSSLRIENDVY